MSEPEDKPDPKQPPDDARLRDLMTSLERVVGPDAMRNVRERVRSRRAGLELTDPWLPPEAHVLTTADRAARFQADVVALLNAMGDAFELSNETARKDSLRAAAKRVAEMKP